MTADEFWALLLDGTDPLVVVMWCAAGILAAISLFMVLLGIRKGVSFFFGMLSGSEDPERWSSFEFREWESLMEYSGTPAALIDNIAGDPELRRAFVKGAMAAGDGSDDRVLGEGFLAVSKLQSARGFD